MIFTSWAFLIYFPIVVGIYFLLPTRYRWLHLLIASYYFYMAWKPAYALLLLLSTVTFYLSALGVDFYKNDTWQRKVIFSFGLLFNISLLFLFKYYNFFEKQSHAVSSWLGFNLNLPTLDLLLPMGISFYTFQGISYLMDVYWRAMPAERHLGILMLYKAFFPQLVAGPIERGTHFIPQLNLLLNKDNDQRIRFEYQRVVSGLRLMLLGFFKKIVLADNLALIVNPVYASPLSYSSTSALIATLAFAFQIYFDFSAYTDIARGAARILGFELMHNFNRPYFSTSIPDFWRRWHISLSSWFRDYLYIPLGGNRVAKWRWMLNLWVVFILCGFWHGANWTFVVWGALYGFYYFVTYMMTNPARWLVENTFLARHPSFCRTFMVMLTFSMVCWAWVVFRAESLSDAVVIWGKIASVPGEIASYFTSVLTEGITFKLITASGLDWLVNPSNKHSNLPMYLMVLVVGYLLISYKSEIKNDQFQFAEFTVSYRWAAYFFALTAIVLLGQFGVTPFLYFQF